MLMIIINFQIFKQIFAYLISYRMMLFSLEYFQIRLLLVKFDHCHIQLTYERYQFKL